MNRRQFVKLTGFTLFSPTLFLAEKEKTPPLGPWTEQQLTPTLSIKELKERRFYPYCLKQQGWKNMAEELPQLNKKFLWLTFDLKNNSQFIHISTRTESHLEDYTELNMFHSKKYPIWNNIPVQEWIEKAQLIHDWEPNFFRNLRSVWTIGTKDKSSLENDYYLPLDEFLWISVKERRPLIGQKTVVRKYAENGNHSEWKGIVDNYSYQTIIVMNVFHPTTQSKIIQKISFHLTDNTFWKPIGKEINRQPINKEYSTETIDKYLGKKITTYYKQNQPLLKKDDLLKQLSDLTMAV